MPTPNHRKNQIPMEQALRRKGLRKGRGSMSWRMAAETQDRNRQECGCQKATQRTSGTRALLLGCYYSCNLTGKAGSTSSQSRTFQGWPAGHVTLIILCTHVPLPCVNTQENAHKVPMLHYSFHIGVSSSLKCLCLSVVVSVSESGKKPFQPGYQTQDKHCHFLRGKNASETTRQ